MEARNKLLLITTQGFILLLNLRRLVVVFSLRLGCIIYNHTVHVNDGCHVQVQPDVIINDDNFISLKFIFCATVHLSLVSCMYIYSLIRCVRMTVGLFMFVLLDRHDIVKVRMGATH